MNGYEVKFIYRHITQPITTLSLNYRVFHISAKFYDVFSFITLPTFTSLKITPYGDICLGPIKNYLNTIRLHLQRISDFSYVETFHSRVKLLTELVFNTILHTR